jgi:hypothetical protein
VVHVNQGIATLTAPNGRRYPIRFAKVNGVWAMFFLSS